MAVPHSGAVYAGASAFKLAGVRAILWQRNTRHVHMTAAHSQERYRRCRHPHGLQCESRRALIGQHGHAATGEVHNYVENRRRLGHRRARHVTFCSAPRSHHQRCADCRARPHDQRAVALILRRQPQGR